MRKAEIILKVIVEHRYQKEMNVYEHKALLYAEKHGIIEYHVIGNEMIYYSSFPLEHRTIKATVNLDIMAEKREYLPKYYIAYSDLIGGKYQSNYCV